MDSEKFILINLVVVAFFVLIFLSARKKRAPSKLNLKRGSWEESPIPVSTIKDVNPRFVYNGHDWDAYEVLGIPAGSSLPVVHQAFHLQVSKTGPEGHEFLQAALQAITERSRI